MLSRLSNLIKRAVVTRAGDDSGNLAIQQISYNGTTGDCDIIFPYGMHANLPIDSLITVVSIEANEENRAGIGGLPADRIKNLPEGEVVFFHPGTKSKIHFKNDGNVDVETNGDLNINADGDVNVTATGDVNVDAKNVIVEAATNIDFTATTLNIDVTNLNITGTTAFIGSITANGKVIDDTHGHTQDADGGGDSEQPISGVT